MAATGNSERVLQFLTNFFFLSRPSQYPQLNDLIIDENTLHIYYNDVIGRGTFALVYKGEFIHTNVAVKKFKTALPKSRVIYKILNLCNGLYCFLLCKKTIMIIHLKLFNY